MSTLDSHVMTMPSLSDLDWAVENLAQTAADPFLARCRPRWNGDTLLAHAGGVARVYPVDAGNQTLALRCWTSISERQEERYRHISGLLQCAELSSLVRVRYIARGLTVGSVTYPVTCMDWVDGLNLSAYLDLNHHDSTTVLRLSRCFADAVRELHAHQISHGDLQDGNIRVTGEGEAISIKLIDYDTLYMPSLGQWQTTPTGIPAYQHPHRVRSVYLTPHDDHFSELVIYLSLRAIAEEPSLWKPQTELQLLFSHQDYVAPEMSPTFARLLRMSPEVRRLARTLQGFCGMQDIRRLPPLEKVLDESAPLLGSYFGVPQPPRGGRSRISAAQVHTFGATPIDPPPFETPPPSRPLPAAVQQYFDSATTTGENQQPAPFRGAPQVPARTDPSASVRTVMGAVLALLVLLVLLYLLVF